MSYKTIIRATVVLTIFLMNCDTSNGVNMTEKCAPGAGLNCADGMLFPLWRPHKDISIADKVGRAIIYFLAICYLFLGISIVSDRFMASIEVITSQEKEVTVTKPDGEKVTFTVQIWNETVSNLTLMALGSSAPEIMLSVIEVRHIYKLL
jgi:solute carrier family 8 (sodium/calcium exchanger)